MSRSLLCETVTGATTAELVRARDGVTAADMVELRLDGVRGLDVPGALEGRRLPVVVTCRPVWEGGRFEGTDEARRRVLSEALALGADYVDVEWRSLGAAGGGGGFEELIAADPRRVVVSAHEFAGMPGDLQGQVRAMRASGAALIKVAVTPRRLSDTLGLRDTAATGDAIVIGMGEVGVPTRLLATRFGSRWTYGGHGIAPGQIPAARMVEAFRFRGIDAGTALYGVTGEAAARVPMAAMQNAAFAAARLDAVCVPLVPRDAEDREVFARALGMTVDEVIWPGSSDNVDALVVQAERQFERWTGQRPAAGVMRTAACAETRLSPSSVSSARSTT